MPSPIHLRKYPRTSVDLPALCFSEGATYQARVSTLGGGGLFLNLPQPLTPGTEFCVRFRPARHLPTIEARAKVVYQLGDQGIGIEFTDIRPEDRQVILRLILHRMGVERKYPRKPFVAQVEHDAGATLGFSRNLSVGGMFIEINEPPPEGSSLKLRFYLDDGGPIVTVAAEVRYVVKGLGMGVQFVDLPPADRSRIDVYVTRGESGTETSHS